MLLLLVYRDCGIQDAVRLLIFTPGTLFFIVEGAVVDATPDTVVNELRVVIIALLGGMGVLMCVTCGISIYNPLYLSTPLTEDVSLTIEIRWPTSMPDIEVVRPHRIVDHLRP